MILACAQFLEGLNGSHQRMVPNLAVVAKVSRAISLRRKQLLQIGRTLAGSIENE